MKKTKLIYAKNKLSTLRRLPINEQGFVLLSLPKKIQAQILKKLSSDEILRIIKYLDLDESADILQQIGSSKRKRILHRLEKDSRKKIESLLRFDPESAAGLMSLDYVEIRSDAKIKDVIKIVKKHESSTGKFPAILVVDNGFVLGELKGHYLASLKQNEKVLRYIKKIPTIRYDAPKKEVIQMFREHPNDKIVVLDDDQSILGIIYSHDALKALDETSIIRRFAGVSKEEDVLDSAKEKVRNRYKWLILNLGTAFIAASVIGMFNKTLSNYIFLAMYLPVIAGMGGNAATQTLAIFVRGIALKEIRLDTKAIKYIIREMIAGIINGLITGSIAACAALIINRNIMLGVIIALAMIINLVVAGFFGAIIPLIMKKLGKDPATSATIFITTATDVFGFLALLGLAKLLL